MKNGLKVPKGTLMFVNHLSMVQDNEHISDADKFYPWRNYDLRQEEQAAGKHQFVMASHTNLTWGYGKHACPGRFFATNEIKMLLTMFLLRYDISATNLPNGLSDVIKGRWYNVTRMPIDHAELKFSDRSSKIPPEVRGYVL
jgi:cytochrome P450